MRIWHPVLFLAALSDCAPGTSSVLVTVNAQVPQVPIDGVARFAVTAKNGGQSASATIAIPGPLVSIPPRRTFALIFDADRRGPIALTVDALDAAGQKLASGTATGVIEPSHQTEIIVLLGGSHPDMGADGGDDGGSLDLAMPDQAAPDDLAAPDLAMPGADGGGDGGDGGAQNDLTLVPDMKVVPTPDLKGCVTCADGCRYLQTDPADCGGCSMPCSSVNVMTQSCAGGMCTGICKSGFANCDATLRANGCNVDTTADPGHCGNCTTACAFGVPCKNSVCTKDRVLVVGTNNASMTNVASTLIASNTFNQVDLSFAAGGSTPTVAMLQNYNAALVFADGSFSDPTALGNNLATYFESGGRVVVAPGANAGSPIAGAFATKYLLILAGAQEVDSNDSIGTLLEPQSPLLKDVASLNVSTASRSTGGPQNSGTVVARWKNTNPNGAPLVVRGTFIVGGNPVNRADLNFYPVSTTWTGDGAQLLRDALVYK